MSNERELPHDPREAAEDRLLDTLLDDALDVLEPPDLTARVRARLAGDIAPRRAEPRRARASTVAVALAAGLVGGASLMWAARWNGAAAHVAEPMLSARIATGELTLWRDDRASELTGGAEFTLRTADALEAGDGAASAQLVAGTLHLAAASRVEFGGAPGASALTATVRRGQATWDDGLGQHVADAEQSLPLAPAPAAAVRERIHALATRVEDLAQELLTARLPQGGLPRQVVPAPTAPPVRPTPDDNLLQTPAFAPILAAVDWAATGAAMRQLPTLSARLVKQLLDSGTYPAELGLQVQELNSVLVQQATLAIRAGAPGRWLNAAFNHPLFVANHVQAALAGTPTPLRAEQREALLRLAVAASEAEAARQRGADGLALATAIADCLARERFTDGVRELLSTAQRELLLPDVLRDTSLDVIGTGVAWNGLAWGVVARDREHFAAQVTEALALRLRLASPATESLRALVSRWASALPEATMRTPVTELERAGVYPMAGVRAAAPHSVALLRLLSEQLDCPPEQRAAVRALLVVFVPYRDGG